MKRKLDIIGWILIPLGVTAILTQLGVSLAVSLMIGWVIAGLIGFVLLKGRRPFGSWNIAKMITLVLCLMLGVVSLLVIGLLPEERGDVVT